jgi:hypothetical protein
MAQAEVAMPRWGETIVGLGRLLEQLGDEAVTAKSDIGENDRLGKGFAGRILSLRRYAQAIAPIADEMAELGKQYATDLVEIDPAMLALVRAAYEEPEVAASEEAQTFFSSLRALCAAADGAVAGNQTLVDSIAQTAKMSREVRPPLARVTGALQAMIDGQALLREWVRSIDDLPGNAGGEPNERDS